MPPAASHPTPRRPCNESLSALLSSHSSLLFSGCSQSGAPAAAPPSVAQAQLVRSIAAAEPQSIPATGTLRAKETATISAQMPGQIRRVLVQAGDRVHAGQLLVELDDAAMRSALNQASAAAEAASRQQMAAQSDASLAAETLARYQTLKNENSVSPAGVRRGTEALAGGAVAARVLCGADAAGAGRSGWRPHATWL